MIVKKVIEPVADKFHTGSHNPIDNKIALVHLEIKYNKYFISLDESFTKVYTNSIL